MPCLELPRRGRPYQNGTKNLNFHIGKPFKCDLSFAIGKQKKGRYKIIKKG